MELPLSRSLQALADPTRREIVRMLGEGDMTAGEIAARFEISAPSVSHHLGVLKNAALVRAERNGQSIVYSLNATVVQEFLEELLRFFKVGKESHHA
jgi:DNA-binding transcriptional ArsR family regulator